MLPDTHHHVPPRPFHFDPLLSLGAAISDEVVRDCPLANCRQKAAVHYYVQLSLVS